MPEIARRAETQFQLEPFASGTLAEQLTLSGLLARIPGSLWIEYRLRGPLECVRRPQVARVSNRCHELWRHTCFELFFGRRGAAAYWEVNLCLSGRWNVYHFDGYRSGMREETVASPPRSRVETGSDWLSFTCAVDVSTMVEDSSELEIGISSIIELVDGGIGYWAVAHPGVTPDFHNRQGFVVQLPKITAPKHTANLE